MARLSHCQCGPFPVSDRTDALGPPPRNRALLVPPSGFVIYRLESHARLSSLTSNAHALSPYFVALLAGLGSSLLFFPELVSLSLTTLVTQSP